MRRFPALLAAVALLLAGCGGPVGADPRRPVRAPHAAAGCSRPAPTTAAGYARMFAALDEHEWGAADGAVSVPVGRRSVWLFGDTFSAGPDGKGRFVHSTAITQRGGCLHVSRGGAQLLPDDATRARPTAARPSRIYWMQGGRALDARTLEITARSVRLVGTGGWDFRDGGFSRTALVGLDAAGDLTFRRWTGTRYGPPPDPGPMLDCDAPAPPRHGHFCYGRHTHPELRLAGGRVLVTTSQNWDDGTLHRFADYRPLFSSAAR